jgi:hypothetical protein
MKRQEAGISEVLDETLILALVIILAVITLALFVGVLPTIAKTAYIVPQFGLKNVSGGAVIFLFDRGGDPVYFNTSPLARYKVTLYIDTTAGSFTAVPAPGLSALKPGDLVYLYYTGSGFNITGNLTGAAVRTLPAGQVTVRMIDAGSQVLIYREVLVKGPVTTANATTAATTGTSTTITITTTTTTTTTTPAGYTISVSWTPPGLGTITPPGTIPAGSGTVTVAKGASQTFTVTPNSNKAVISISLDGTQVSSGGAVGESLTYTLTNVQAAHTLTAAFG